MNPIVVIPARMASTRLPGKPLADIGGKPMIIRVAEQGRAAGLGPVVIAAGDIEIAEAAHAHGFEAVLTDPELPSGSDRVMAALEAVDPEGAHDVVVNLQGDMPTISPGAITAAVDALAAVPDADIATLAVATEDPAERDDPNVVKAVVALPDGARRGRALYFTRAAAPTGPGPVFHHVGLYVYRRTALACFTTLSPSPLEQRERLEQLRALENGMRIEAAVIEESPLGVDSSADLEAVRAIYAAKT
ncbi:MAG: 3-deoxy-manno-octulosonate cytidylyltransferase [Maricaulaceae bacterium]|jgi:3-deoxy-manno-octulosonate cytidylyltransferase (CMP-KDO synthetase)